MRTPHLHVGTAVIGADAHPLGGDFAHLHLPTGQIGIDTFIRFLIQELHVVPNRDDWGAVLEEIGPVLSIATNQSN